jgi:hypothetical protein
MRQRIGHYDRLIEQMAQNDGVGVRFEENQPLTDEEMLELKSFLKTDSFIDAYNPTEKMKSRNAKEKNKEYNPVDLQLENSNNILMELNR